jgi:hypothetical protein
MTYTFPAVQTGLARSRTEADRVDHRHCLHLPDTAL